MEISEAIKHAREVASKYNNCSRCSKDHNQLADWLEELVRLQAELARVTAELDAARELLAEYSGVDSCKTIKTCFGYPLDEVQRLVEADKAAKLQRAVKGDNSDESAQETAGERLP